MAFGATIQSRGLSGNKWVIYGTFTGGAPTAAEIVTGLQRVEYFSLTGASAVSQASGTVTVTSAATSGFWKAEGY